MKAKLVKVVIGYEYRLDDENGLLIASSLYSSKNKLSLKNCQAIERGYDLDELASKEYLDGYDSTKFCRLAFKDGFQKALELMGDKKFSEEDVKNAIEYGIQSVLQAVPGFTSAQSILDAYIQSLQQTEWDVTYNLEELDADGCLILKRI